MKITFTSTRRIVGNPSTFLFGPRKGQPLYGEDIEVLDAYSKALRLKRCDVPPNLLYVHDSMLELAMCHAIGEEPPPYLVGGLEHDDFDCGHVVPQFPFLLRG